MALTRSYLEDHPRAVACLARVCRILTIVGYIAYPLLLVLQYFLAPDMLARSLEVPALGFIIVSVFRRIYNAPRPYEVTGQPALVPKSTHGKSFPSRHTFCMFMIAFSWMRWIWPVGVMLAVCGCALAAIRVMLGVHFTRDVVAGAVIAALFALVGYVIVP